MPQSRTAQTVASRAMGHSPALDADGYFTLIAIKRYVVKTAAYTVLETESGTCFLTTGATAAFTFTLPAISTGPWHFEFIAVADFGMTVAAATVDTMLTFNDAAADSVAFSTASEIMGARILVDCDGTTVVATGIGVSHRQTMTVTS